MPTTPSIWRPSSIGVIATPSVADQLAAWNALFVAEVAANPSTAIWEVSDFNAGVGTLELRRRDGSPGRVLIFGGSTPNVNAVWDGAGLNANSIYAVWASAAATTGPETAYTSGNPYSTISTLGVLSKNVVTGQNRIRYWENNSTLVLVAYGNAVSDQTGLWYGGDLMDGPDGNPIDMASGSGGSALRTDALIVNNVGSGKFWNPADAGTALNAKTCAIRGGLRRRAMSLLSLGLGSVGVNTWLRNTAATESFLIKIHFTVPELQEFIGNLRQIQIGPPAPLGAEIPLGGGRKAYAISADPNAVADAIWLVDPAA